MRHYYIDKEKEMCKKYGHDWAFADKNTHMVKICIRCGESIIFFPEEDGQEIEE